MCRKLSAEKFKERVIMSNTDRYYYYYNSPHCVLVIWGKSVSRKPLKLVCGTISNITFVVK